MHTFNKPKFVSDLRSKIYADGDKVVFREITEATGVSGPTIFRIANKDRTPRMETFLPLCDWMGTTPNDYFIAK